MKSPNTSQVHAKLDEDIQSRIDKARKSARSLKREELGDRRLKFWHNLLKPTVRVVQIQRSFSEAEYACKKKLTRRDLFLNEIDQLAPWALLEAQIAPFYADDTGKRGRPSIGLSRMLRLYVVRQCFGLSDEGTENAVYDSQAVRLFVGIDISHASAPDVTTLLKFRRLLETHQLTQKIFAAINQLLSAKGLLLKEGTIVDATADSGAAFDQEP